MSLFETIKARHKWNTALILWNLAWAVGNIIIGAWLWAAIFILLGAGILWLAVWEEKMTHRAIEAYWRRVYADRGMEYPEKR